MDGLLLPVQIRGMQNGDSLLVDVAEDK